MEDELGFLQWLLLLGVILVLSKTKQFNRAQDYRAILLPQPN